MERLMIVLFEFFVMRSLRFLRLPLVERLKVSKINVIGMFLNGLLQVIISAIAFALALTVGWLLLGAPLLSLPEEEIGPFVVTAIGFPLLFFLPAVCLVMATIFVGRLIRYSRVSVLRESIGTLIASAVSAVLFLAFAANTTLPDYALVGIMLVSFALGRYLIYTHLMRRDRQNLSVRQLSRIRLSSISYAILRVPNRLRQDRKEAAQYDDVYGTANQRFAKDS